MYHFLPLAEKRVLRREYRIRFGIVVLIALSFVGVLGGAFLLPAWFLSDIKEQTVAKRMDILQTMVAKKQDGALTSILNNTKNDIKLLTTGEEFLPFRTVLETIIDNRLPGVSIQSFSFARISVAGDVAVTIQGISKDRDSLVNFRKNLEREKMFTRVDLPIADFAKGKNADFTIQLTAVALKP